MSIPEHKFVSAHFTDNARTTVEAQWEAPDGKYAGVEIPGNDEYIVWNEVIVQDAGQLGGPHTGLICLTAEGVFYNPYIQSNMSVSLKLENFPIGLDIDATPYG